MLARPTHRGRPIEKDNAALRLLTQYIDIVRTGDALTDLALAQSVSDHLIDLAALALDTVDDNAELARRRGGTAARLVVIKSDILRALSRSELSMEFIAAKHGISPSASRGPRAC